MMVMNLKFAYKMCVIWVSLTLRVSGFVPFFFSVNGCLKVFRSRIGSPCTSLEAVFIITQMELTTFPFIMFLSNNGVSHRLSRSYRENVGFGQPKST